jgi:hypothetical protein
MKKQGRVMDEEGVKSNGCNIEFKMSNLVKATLM